MNGIPSVKQLIDEARSHSGSDELLDTYAFASGYLAEQLREALIRHRQPAPRLGRGEAERGGVMSLARHRPAGLSYPPDPPQDAARGGRQERTVRLATMGTQDHRVVLNDGTNQITLTFQDRDTADNMVWRVVKSCGFRECE